MTEKQRERYKQLKENSKNSKEFVEYAKSKNVKLGDVAFVYGMGVNSFSHLLSTDVNSTIKQDLIGIVDYISSHNAQDETEDY